MICSYTTAYRPIRRVLRPKQTSQVSLTHRADGDDAPVADATNTDAASPTRRRGVARPAAGFAHRGTGVASALGVASTERVPSVSLRFEEGGERAAGVPPRTEDTASFHRRLGPGQYFRRGSVRDSSIAALVVGEGSAGSDKPARGGGAFRPDTHLSGGGAVVTAGREAFMPASMYNGGIATADSRAPMAAAAATLQRPRTAQPDASRAGMMSLRRSSVADALGATMAGGGGASTGGMDLGASRRGPSAITRSSLVLG
jgi:hypothetical protein